MKEGRLGTDYAVLRHARLPMLAFSPFLASGLIHVFQKAVRALAVEFIIILVTAGQWLSLACEGSKLDKYEKVFLDLRTILKKIRLWLGGSSLNYIDSPSRRLAKVSVLAKLR